jgi:hypothetical protein
VLARVSGAGTSKLLMDVPSPDAGMLPLLSIIMKLVCRDNGCGAGVALSLAAGVSACLKCAPGTYKDLSGACHAQQTAYCDRDLATAFAR